MIKTNLIWSKDFTEKTQEQELNEVPANTVYIIVHKWMKVICLVTMDSSVKPPVILHLRNAIF